MFTKHPRQPRIAVLTHTPSKMGLFPSSFGKSVVTLQISLILWLGLRTKQGYPHLSPMAEAGAGGEESWANLLVMAKAQGSPTWREEENQSPASHRDLHFPTESTI